MTSKSDWRQELEEFYTTDDGPNTRCFCDDVKYPMGHSRLEHDRSRFEQKRLAEVLSQHR